ncbi:8-hydroxyquercetin 8-O-methyltransferase [Capsicum chinense]|nr:8-hydroxyquercetin 8-O-methyltransferase [Capsicum chinense]
MALPNDNNDDMYKTREVLDAQTYIWNYTFNFINSVSLKCAIQLGIPDIIHSHGQAMTLSDLVDALSINNNKVKLQDCIYCLMRILVHAGVLLGLKSLVDVGDGTGTITKAIAQALPQINCILFVLPHVIEGLEESKNLIYMGGDMFISIPSADTILLKVRYREDIDQTSLGA